MRRLPSLFNVALLTAALLSLSLVAIQPFTQSQLLLSDDAALHLYRTIVLDHSLRYDHPIYPRFSSALAYGYGAPLFNYFSPFAYYLPRTLHIIGLSFVDAWLAAMVLYLWVALVGAFLLGRILTNTTGGIIAAVAYLYSPYLLYDAVSRGTITEVAGLALLPVVLYALTRLAKRPSVANFLIAAAAYAAFIPLHNIVTLHGSLLIAAYAMVIAFTSVRPFRTMALLACVGILSIGLTAFFWLPALGETSWIKLPAITAALSNLDVTRHLRDIRDVLALPVPIDPRQQQAPVPITVSWVALIAAGVGLTIAFVTKRLRVQFLFWAAVLLFSLFMNTPASAWVWEYAPLLYYTQFAWRILGIASLALAVLTGLSIYMIEPYAQKRRLGSLATMGLLIGLVLYSLSFTYRPTQSLDAVDVLSAHRHERVYGEVALSSYSEYLPAQASPFLDPEALLPLWEASPVIPRWTNTDGIQIQQESWGGIHATFQISVDQARRLVLAWLYMPNWEVYVNGLRVTTIANIDGLLSFRLPSGRVNVSVRYALSDFQRLGLLISGVSSGVSLCLLIAALWMGPKSAQTTHGQPLASSRTLFLLCALTGLGLIAFKATIVDQTNNLWRQTRWSDGYFDNLTIRGSVFNRELMLLSAEVQVEQNQRGEIAIRTHWTPLQPMANNYGTLYSVRNREGIEIARGTNYQPAGVDTSRWIVGLYVQDAVRLVLPEGTLPGPYDVFVSVYAQDTLLPTINDTGNADRPDVKLATVQIAPQEAPAISELPDGPVALLTTPDLPQGAMEGSAFVVNLELLAGLSAQDAFQYRLRWAGEGGASTAAEWQPLAPEYPAALWRAGEVYRIPAQVSVPLFNADGAYNLWLEMADADEKIVCQAFLGGLNVSTPTREFTQPQIDQALNATWQNGIQLVGYRMRGGQLSLVWTTSTILKDDLRLFVHRLDDEGVIIDQHDEVPVNWTRPTTSWLPGEYLTTTHVFEETRQAPVLRVGFYDPVSFARIALDSGETALTWSTAVSDN